MSKYIVGKFIFLVMVLLSCTAGAQTITYFHNDNSGSPIVATDSSGNVLWKENYRPYGDKLNNQPASSTNKIGFAGKPFDNSTGLSYSGARYYDPIIGRFVGIDPQGFDPENIQSFNRYAYANNNPYKFVDPDGHSPLDVAFLAYDIGKLGVALYKGEGIGDALADVALSTVGVISPIPGAGQVLKGVRAADKGMDLAKAADHAADSSKIAKTCCFVAGTPVQAVDGYRPIESLKLGDLVYSKNIDTGETSFKPVTHLFTKLRPIFELRVVSDSGEEKLIETTEDHPFYVVNKGWVYASSLTEGNIVETLDGDTIKVIAGWVSGRVATTYNIEVADFHTYYATEFDLLVHNCDFDAAKNAQALTKSAEKGIRSYEKRIAEHETKLAEFKANPTVRPGMNGQSESKIKAAQESRIRHLEKEIQTFKENIEKLKNGE